nr:CHAT domain-containing protein [Rathayibacter sp. VKM Ac-2857]
MARARWLIPEYQDPLPFLTNERAFLEKRMRAQPLAPADHTGLVSELTARGFDLLHFAGHGDVDADEPLTQYLLVDPGATVRYADTEVRAGFLPLTPPPTRTGPIVMLNACRTGELRADHGGFATAFLQGGAEIFVGCRWSVGSRAASSFTSAFYLALRDGATLAQASCRARESARSDDDASWIAYTVYGNPQATVDFVDWTDDHLEETP